MVSPSKTKHSRVAANQQQQQRTANASKVKLVKGPTPLVHHRFYLDIQKHQLANKIEYTIKELGGHIEFFLSKDITHFITDKDYSHYQQSGTAQNPEAGGPSNSYQNPVTPTTPLTPKTPLSTATNRHHYLQYVNEASPSSPSCGTATGQSSYLHQGGPGSVGAASGTTYGGSESRPAKPAAPRSRADAMLQRVRQQQQLQQSPGGSSSYNQGLLAQRNNASRPCSPLSPSPVPSPTPAASSTAAVRLDRNSQSPAQLAKSWGKPIWSTEYAIKFLSKVIGSCKQENQQLQQGQQQQNLRFGKGSSKGAEGKTTPQHLRGDYIKIESHQRHHYRPAFALFKAWPALNLVAKSNHSPFDSARGKDGQRSVQPSVQPATTTAQATTQVQEDRPSAVKTATTNQTTTNATAKQENTQQQQQQQQQCGYCEICRIEYDVLANHLNADEHRAFVRNDGNFAQLDQLIADGGVDLGAFLKSVEQEQQQQQEELTIEPSEDCEPAPRKDATEEPGDGEECEKEEEVVKVKKRRVDKEEETLGNEEEESAVKKGSNVVQEEEQEEEEQKVLEGRVLELRITPVAVPLKTYSRKSKEIPPSPLSTPSAAGIKRTYAGRKSARTTTVVTPSPAPATPAAIPAIPTAALDLGEPDVADSQMFGRRSAIHHHPHNTLSHHNHQKAKAARQQQLKEQQEKEQEKQVPEPEPIPEDDAAAAAEQVVMKLHGTNESTTTTKSNSKMGMKQSSVVKSPSAAAAAAELALECDGLDPKNTKRISLGLRQNPKRANLNEDFTSLLDETLEPIRKPARIRRESVRRVNYSEPREDEIASQEELIESILLESTAQEAAAAAAAAEESCRGKKKAGGSPKRSGSDVKIRGIRWRAPSPQSRPPVKSPLLYQVIEEPKAKSKKNNSASPTKGTSGTPGSPTKASKNGLIVKIRRVRQSELSLLNDEAENFMFPKKDDSSDEDTDEDRQTSSEANPGDYSQEVPSSDYDHPHNSSKRKSAGTPLPTPQPIKKRPVGRPPASAKESTPTPAPATPDPSDTSTPRSRRAGVRGVAALLHDNAEYYKFPDPGSRLRFPEAPIQPAGTAANPEVDDDDSEVQAALMPAPAPKRRGRKPAKTPAASAVTAVTPLSPEQRQQQDLLLATRGASGCSSPYQHQEQLSSCGKVIADYSKNSKGNCGASSSKEDGMGAVPGMFKWSTFVRNCAQIEPYRFAFERVPSLEPWYETFQRQDEASEKMYEYFGNTAYRKLPYEMGGLPPLRQNCCILNYRMKSKTPESTVPSSSNSSTCDGATTSNTKDQPAKPSSSSTSTSEPLSLPLKKRKLLVDSDRPRKSPREHASTLAILSLLQQQTQVNRRRTISGGSSVPLNLPPPSPVPSAQVGYSPKKEAIKAAQQQQQEADSALGDEIRSSCGSDPVTEKDEPMAAGSGGGGIGAKKIKFDPPIMPEQSFVNYKVMCQQLEEFLEAADGIPEDDALPELPEAVPIVTAPNPSEPLKQNLLNIVQACDKEPPLSLKLVSRHESIVRKIVQYDRRPRPLSAITIKSFDGGGGGGGSTSLPGLGTPGGTCLGIFKKRINRTGWPNVKKRIVTRKQHQQKGTKRDSAESAGAGTGAGEVKKEPEPATEDTSRKSSTEESQVSAETTVEEEEAVKQEVEGEEAEEEGEDDDEDEFEDTMTMLDPEEVAAAVAAKTNGETAKKEVAAEKVSTEQLLTDDEEEDKDAVEEEEREKQREEKAKKEVEESRHTPEPTKTEEILIPSRPCPRSSTTSTLPSSKYVTKTTTTMTRIDYNVPTTPSSEPSQKAPAPMEVASTTTVAEECDSISSRSIFVSDDCDTTSSTLINMCPEADPLALPCTPPVDAVENETDSRPVTPAVVTTVRSRQNTTRHVGGGSPGKKRGNLQPIVCLQKINCTAATAASSMRTRSSSRTPIKKTYKRSVFTSALVNSSGKPLKKKRKRKKLKLMNGGSTAGTTSPSCSEGHNSSSIADEPTNEEEDEAEEEPEDESGTDGTDSPTVVRRGPSASKNRVPTPSPVKFSPRKLRKPRGRWYRER